MKKYPLADVVVDKNYNVYAKKPPKRKVYNKGIKLGLRKTKKQHRVIEALANPLYKDLTDEKLCKIAGITPNYFSYLKRKPEFIRAVHDHCAGLCLQHTPQIIQAFANKGKKGEYQQGKLILEMAGAYQEQPLIQQVIQQATRQGMSEEEVDDKIANMLSKQQDTIEIAC